MTYRVLDNEGLNYADRTTNKRSYVAMVESALNAMEAEGWNLVAIEPGDEHSVSHYIFHKDDSSQ